MQGLCSLALAARGLSAKRDLFLFALILAPPKSDHVLILILTPALLRRGTALTPCWVSMSWRRDLLVYEVRCYVLSKAETCITSLRLGRLS